MARALRIEFEGALYHVTSRGNERKNIFFTKRDYEKFKEYVSEAEKKFRFILHCYVLMTNHYHLLIETPEKNLQRVMHYINSSYSVYTNTKRRRSGHLFQGRYKAIIVDRDNYILELSRYIHLNPVRAKIVGKPEDYPYSSYHAYSYGAGDEIVSTSGILKLFSDEAKTAQGRYKAFVESELETGLASPLNNVHGGTFLGDEDFIMDVLGNLDEESFLQYEQIANRKALRLSMSVEVILARLRDHEQISSKQILTKKMNVKKLKVYFLKKYSGATNREISAVVGLKTHCASAKIYERFLKEVENDEGLKRQLESLEGALSLFKPRSFGQPT